MLFYKTGAGFQAALVTMMATYGPIPLEHAKI
ncbi:uncharacterized protein FFNC_15708 [Fusarium fujikuroi]|nr:uncharacterized protein FFNC_15708 [Fusarium fujikuroi]